MATGILGQASPAATTNTTVYTVPASTTATFNVSIVNTTAAYITIRLAVSATTSPTSNEYLEYDVLLQPNGVLERTGIVAQATKNVVVYASATGLSVSVYGYEE